MSEYPDPATGAGAPAPWPGDAARVRAGQAIVVLLGFIAGQLATSILAGLFLGLLWGLLNVFDLRPTGTLTEFNRLAEPYLILISAVGGAGAGLLFAHVLVRIPTGHPYRDTVGWRRGPLRLIWWGFVSGVGFSMLFAILATHVWPLPEDAAVGPLAEMARRPGVPRLIWAGLALAFGPPVEEFLFRGVLFTGLANSFGAAAAVVLTTLLFTLLHIPEARYYWPALITIGAMGLTSALLRLRTGALGPSIALHLGYNGLMVVGALAGS